MVAGLLKIAKFTVNSRHQFTAMLCSQTLQWQLLFTHCLKN